MYKRQSEEALKHSNALVIVTEWKAFKSPDFDHVRRYLTDPIIFDGRNLYDPKLMSEMGFDYYGIGRHSRSDLEREMLRAPIHKNLSADLATSVFMPT